MTKEEVYRTKKHRGQRTRNEDERGYVGPWTRRRGRTVAPGAGPAKGRANGAEQGGHHRRAEVLFLLKIVSSLFFSILQMVSHVFMADVGHSGQILSMPIAPGLV